MLESASSQRASELRSKLSAFEKTPWKICGPDSRLLIEGYPRCGNSFLVGTLLELTHRKRFKLGHHTHRLENVPLADLFDVPIILLVREPVDAITSFQIFSKRPIDYCAQRYVEFYSVADTVRSPILLLDFRNVIENTKAVFQQIEAFAPNIEFPDELDEAKERARLKATQRAATRFGANNTAKIGLPQAEREKIKAQVRTGVVEYLSENPTAQETYERLASRLQN